MGTPCGRAAWPVGHAGQQLKYKQGTPVDMCWAASWALVLPTRALCNVKGLLLRLFARSCCTILEASCTAPLTHPSLLTIGLRPAALASRAERRLRCAALPGAGGDLPDRAPGGGAALLLRPGAVRPCQALEETFLIARLAVALYSYLGLVLCGLIRRWRRPS